MCVGVWVSFLSDPLDATKRLHSTNQDCGSEHTIWVDSSGLNGCAHFFSTATANVANWVNIAQTRSKVFWGRRVDKLIEFWLAGWCRPTCKPAICWAEARGKDLAGFFCRRRKREFFCLLPPNQLRRCRTEIIRNLLRNFKRKEENDLMSCCLNKWIIYLFLNWWQQFDIVLLKRIIELCICWWFGLILVSNNFV